MRLALTLTLTAALTLTLNANVNASTPTPNARAKWYVATVAGEHYGPFRGIKTASAFCASVQFVYYGPRNAVPAPKYTCRVEPVMPPAEWMRKGAR